MERASPTPIGGIRPPDLVELADRPGPFATIWLELSGQGSYGEHADNTRIEVARRDLVTAGAPEDVAAGVEEALHTVDSAHGVVAVADGTGVALLERLPQPPRRAVARWEPLPSISPVLEHRQGDIPVMIVLADRLGADVVASAPDDGDLLVDVEGDDRPIRKVAPGGWSQRRYQQRVENTWERNANQVTGVVTRLAARIEPVLLVLGGDVRAVDLIKDELPGELRPVVRTVTGGRATDGSAARRDEEIERLVRTAIAAETVELLHAFEQEIGRADRATNGAAATMHALQQAQVDVLLVHDDLDDERIAWFTETPGLVALEREGLPGDSRSARLVDVAINAALRTGAAIRIVPDAAALDEHIGALLRWGG